MCGIAGLLDQKQSPSDNKQLLEKMLHIQHHRGPDATGVWSDDTIFLGHNRLSIIDLSEAANQPMHFKDFAMTYNGEIYNYIELKQELEVKGHIFVNHSDSEVILHAFAEWGADCVQRFVGMWSFVIWDKVKKSLFASRDRFGIKPFNYIFQSGRFYFASEIKTLKLSPLFTNDINENQVARGLQMGWLSYLDETYFKCIKAIPAAHNLTLDQNGLKIVRYWDIKTGTYT